MNPREQRLQARGRREPPGRVRLAIGPAKDSPDLTSVWATRSEGNDGATVFTLAYEYEDLQPAAGWYAASAGVEYRVAGVEGGPTLRKLACAAEGGAE